MTNFSSFIDVIDHAHHLMRTESEIVHPKLWQSVDATKPEMATHEVQGFFASCPIGSEDPIDLQAGCMPNLPWAERHFIERVCGEPLNPGDTWTQWPYSLKANSFRDTVGQFNHNYMERYWPKWAGGATLPEGRLSSAVGGYPVNFGIRYAFGDLHDVVDLFKKDPLTRQAFVPIFFPEDTGAHHGGRIPCTLGYHFIIRRNQLHVVYFMRSCDLRRHFNDDCYLTARLAVWMLQQLRAENPGVFDEVSIGNFTCYITSLHIFRNDWYALYGDSPAPDRAGTGRASSPAGAATSLATGPLPAGYRHGGHQVARQLVEGMQDIRTVGGRNAEIEERVDQRFRRHFDRSDGSNG